MKAPAIDGFIQRFRRERYDVDEQSKVLMDELYSLIDKMEPCGDDDRHVFWVCEERGTIEDYGNYEELLADGIVETKEQFEDCWHEEYPNEVSWYLVTTLQYKEYRTIGLNSTAVVQIEPDGNGWEYDISDFLQWLIGKVKEILLKVKNHTYFQWVNSELPYRYRKGSILTEQFWAIFPEEEQKHFEIISKDECIELERNIQNIVPDANRVKHMTVSYYLSLCRIGYEANKLKGTDTMSDLELYQRYADDRDGGLLTIDAESPTAFDEWYGLSHDEKWKLENPTHIWEAIKGGSRTRVHFSVRKDEQGYFFMIYSNEFCCPEYAVRFYNAIRKHNLPVFLMDGEKISRYLNGKGKIGIVPCYDDPTDYFYGGFSDKEVGEFFHLPESNTEVFIPQVQWEPLLDIKLK